MRIGKGVVPISKENFRILEGDVRERLRDLPDASVQCCVTSPPYW